MGAGILSLVHIYFPVRVSLHDLQVSARVKATFSEEYRAHRREYIMIRYLQTHVTV